MILLDTSLKDCFPVSQIRPLINDLLSFKKATIFLDKDIPNKLPTYIRDHQAEENVR